MGRGVRVDVDDARHEVQAAHIHGLARGLDVVESGHDPEDGDLIYYVPWGNLGFYYNAEGIGYSDATIHLGTYDAQLEQLEEIIRTVDLAPAKAGRIVEEAHRLVAAEAAQVANQRLTRMSRAQDKDTHRRLVALLHAAVLPSAIQQARRPEHDPRQNVPPEARARLDGA